jgi:vitamin B12 transporter
MHVSCAFGFFARSSSSSSAWAAWPSAYAQPFGRSRAKRALRLTALGVAVSGLASLGSVAHAQPAASVHSADARLVITGSRLPMTPELLAADVVVIDRADIEASTADSLADLLRREAGVQLSRNGGPGQSTGAL